MAAIADSVGGANGNHEFDTLHFLYKAFLGLFFFQEIYFFPIKKGTHGIADLHLSDKGFPFPAVLPDLPKLEIYHFKNGHYNTTYILRS